MYNNFFCLSQILSFVKLICLLSVVYANNRVHVMRGHNFDANSFHATCSCIFIPRMLFGTS